MFSKFTFLLILSLFFFVNPSQAQEKPVLVFLMEGPCKSEQEIIHAEEFVQKIQEKVIFETLDCNSVSLEERQKWKNKYHVDDLPRLILFDHNRNEIARYGFIGEKPETLAGNIVNVCIEIQDLDNASRRLDELNLPNALLEDLYKRALTLKQEVNANIFLEKGVKNNSLFFLLEKYRLLSQKGHNAQAIREKVLSLDPENKQEGLYSLALIDFQTLATLYPSKEAVRPLEDYLVAFGDTDLKNRWRLEMMVAQFYLNYDEWATSLKHAEMALSEAPQDVKREIGKCCDYITRQLESNLADCIK